MPVKVREVASFVNPDGSTLSDDAKHFLKQVDSHGLHAVIVVLGKPMGDQFNILGIEFDKSAAFFNGLARSVASVPEPTVENRLVIEAD